MKALFVLAGVALASCARDADTKSSAAKTSVPAKRTVEVVRLTPTAIETTLRLPGELTPYETVDLHARVTATVASISVDRGSRVHKGDVLVRLEAPELTAQRAEAEARASAQEGTYQRLMVVAKTPGAVSDDEIEQAKGAAGAERERAQALRSVEAYTTLRAPFDGVVTERFVHIGALVTPTSTQPLVRVEDIARLRLTVALPEHAIGSIVLGSTAHFHLSAYPQAVFDGVVRRPAGAVDPRSRTMPVELEVDNHDGRLAPGAYAEIDWPLKHTSTFVIPRTAIVQTTARLFVARVRDGKVERVDVRRGLSRGDDTEIFGDIAEGDLIVRRGSDDLAEGSEVDSTSK